MSKILYGLAAQSNRLRKNQAECLGGGFPLWPCWIALWCLQRAFRFIGRWLNNWRAAAV